LATYFLRLATPHYLARIGGYARRIEVHRNAVRVGARTHVSTPKSDRGRTVALAALSSTSWPPPARVKDATS